MAPNRDFTSESTEGRGTIRDQELPEIGFVASALIKAIAATRLYPADNPASLSAKKTFDDVIDAVLQKRRSLRFVVGRRTLFFGDAQVLNEEHGESVAASLHKDGIREIAFHRGLTQEETSELLTLLARSSNEADRTSDDLRTLFWECSFTHITLVAIDDGLDLGSAGDEILAEFDRSFMRQIDLEVYDVDDEAEVETAAREMSGKLLSNLAEGGVDLVGVSAEDRARLLAEIAEEEDPLRMRSDFARILVEVLLVENDSAELVGLLDVCSRHMALLLAEGNLGDYGWLLGVLVNLRAGRPGMPTEMSRALESAIGWIWNGDARETLRVKLDRGDIEMLQGLPVLVQAVPDDYIRELCLLLGDLETGRVRRRLIELVVERCHTHWTVLLPLLDDSRWYLVRNIVLILGRVGNRLIASSLHRALEHQDYRVRKEALTALDRLDPERAATDLERALGDEERRIRIFAAQTLATRGETAAPPLLATVTNPDFAGRQEDEIFAIYAALAHAGGRAVLAHLESASKPSGLFRKGPSEETRAAACTALGRMSEPKAIEILGALSGDKSARVRESARRALVEAGKREAA